MAQPSTATSFLTKLVIPTGKKNEIPAEITCRLRPTRQLD
jgi:hypothetical protein